MNTVGSVLVDTNIVVAYFRGDEALPSRFAEFKPMYMPWVVLGELHFGAHRAQRRKEQFAYISDFLTTAVVLFPDQGTTECYGQLKADLAQMGRPIPDNDLWIAAIACQHSLPLATRDAHFAHVPRLKTLAWQLNQPTNLRPACLPGSICTWKGLSSGCAVGANRAPMHHR